jgi:hypothetical protein
MKTLIALIVALGISTSTFAGTNGDETPVKSPVSLRKVDDSKVQLLYGLIPNGTITVKIYDQNHTLVQKDRIFKREAFAKYYDFSLLSPAKYNIEVIENSEVVETFELDLRSNSYEPVIYSKVEKISNNKFKLLVNSLLPTDLSIMIFENGQLVHEEVVDSVNGFQKLYTFSRFSSNPNVEFIVKSQDGFRKLMAAK